MTCAGPAFPDAVPALEPEEVPGHLCLTLGSGRTRAVGSGQHVQSADELAQVLAGHRATDSWWSPHAYIDGHRRSANWRSACAVVLDVDFRNIGGKHAPPDDKAIANLATIAASVGATLYHATPRGGRLVWMLRTQCTDRNRWLAAARALCSRLGHLLKGSGFSVDTGASCDFARFFWAPTTTVEGSARSATVQVLGDAVDVDDLALPERQEEVVADRDAGTVQEAVQAYRQQHPLNAPRSGGTCPLCGHNDCFGTLPGTVDRWYCWSDAHEQDGRGIGLRGSRGWHGDVLDIDAHAAGTTRVELLRCNGYLREPAAVSPGNGPAQLPSPPTRSSLRLRLRDRSEIILLPGTRWLIRGYLTCGSVMLLGSDPNLGKSTLANGWAHCIWTGLDWMGHPVLAGSVLFILGEDVRGASLRARAWEKEYGSWDVADRYIEYADRMPALCLPEGQLELRRVLTCLAHERGHAPALVVIDTLSTVWGSEPENSAELAAALMSALSTLADEFGCTFVLIHHLNKVPNGHKRDLTLSSIRGAGAFVGSADDVLALEEVEPGTAKLFGLKSRNTDKAPAKFLRVHRVSLGVNEDGDDVSSVILIEAPETAAPSPAILEKAHQDHAWQAAERRIDNAIDALRRLKTARSRTQVVNRMTGKRTERFAAVDDALGRELIINVGTAKTPCYVVAADQPEGVRKTPQTPEPGTGNRSPADAGPVPVPSDEGTGSQTAGTGNRPEDVEPLQTDTKGTKNRRRRKPRQGGPS